MKTFKDTKKRMFSRKLIITVLLIISFAMTSSTFAYWADTVVGAEKEAQASFIIGAPLFDDHEFVLTDNTPTYSYLIPVEDLLENPEVNIHELVFGVSCTEFDDKDVCEIELDYEIIVMKNGKLQNKNKTKRYGSLINIEVVESPTELTEDDNLETVRLNISLNEENKRNDYKNLPKFDIYIKIDMDIEYNK